MGGTMVESSLGLEHALTCIMHTRLVYTISFKTRGFLVFFNLVNFFISSS